MECLQRAFATNQGIGATLIIEGGAGIIAVENLGGPTNRVYVDAANLTVIAGVAIQHLPSTRAALDYVIAFAAIEPLVGAATANQKVVAGVAVENLPRARTGPKNVIIVAAAQTLVRARTAQNTVVAVAAIPFIRAKQGTSPGRDRIIAIIAIEKFNMLSPAIAKQAIITDAASKLKKGARRGYAIGSGERVMAVLASQQFNPVNHARQQQIIVATAVNHIHIDQDVIAGSTGTAARAKIDRDAA
jgi:hypothetical protein